MYVNRIDAIQTYQHALFFKCGLSETYTNTNIYAHTLKLAHTHACKIIS